MAILALNGVALRLLNSHVQAGAKLSMPGIFIVRRYLMLNWALTFLIVAIIAAILGFGGIAGTAAWIAKVFFIVFLVLFLVSLIAGRPWGP